MELTVVMRGPEFWNQECLNRILINGSVSYSRVKRSTVALILAALYRSVGI